MIDQYKKKTGRYDLTNDLMGKKPKHIQGKFKGLMDLINYRRDEASHGTPLDIPEYEAYDALSRLMRLSYFVRDHWAELTEN